MGCLMMMIVAIAGAAFARIVPIVDMAGSVAPSLMGAG
jgi:hypothetical protein